MPSVNSFNSDSIGECSCQGGGDFSKPRSIAAVADDFAVVKKANS